MFTTQVYLYKQKHQVVLTDPTITSMRYNPVYAKNLKLHKGTDNVLIFTFVNQDQKPVNNTTATFVFRLINREGTDLILAKTMDAIDARKGTASVTISEQDLDKVESQPAHYSIERSRSNSNINDAVFVDDHLGGRGVVEILDSIMPSHTESHTITIPGYWDGTPSSGSNSGSGNPDGGVGNPIANPDAGNDFDGNGSNGSPNYIDGGWQPHDPVNQPSFPSGNGVTPVNESGSDGGEGVDTEGGVANPIVDPDSGTPEAGGGGGGVANPIVNPDEGAGAGQGGGGVANPIVYPGYDDNGNPIQQPSFPGNDGEPIYNPTPGVGDTDHSTAVTHYSSQWTGMHDVQTLQYKTAGFTGYLQVEGATAQDHLWYEIGTEVDLSNTDSTGYINILGHHPYLRVRIEESGGNITELKVR